MPSGFFGVDIFFVISGFVITGLIVRSLENNSFSIKEFYIRRITRLFPAFLTMLVFVWLLGWCIFFPVQLKTLASASSAALFSYSNYHFLADVDYFASDESHGPLLHTWSLGIEEQFYFLFPLLFVFLHKKNAKDSVRFALFLVLVAVSIVISCYLTSHHSKYSFFAFESRAWEIACGVLAFLAPRASSKAVNVTAGGAGLLLCIFSLLYPFRLNGVPAPYAMVPVASAMLLVWSRCGGVDSCLFPIFNSSPLRFIGEISYPLYLFHWPIIVFYRQYYEAWNLVDKGLCVSMSLLLSFLVHFHIELPLRKTRDYNRLFKRMALVFALIFVSVKIIKFKDGHIGGVMETWLSKVNPEHDEIKAPTWKTTRFGDPGAPSVKVVIVGDSHAQCLIFELDKALAKEKMAGAFWVAPGNLPAIHIETSQKSHFFENDLLPFLKNHKPEFVVFAANWKSYFQPYKTYPLNPLRTSKALNETFSAIRENGSRIVVLQQIPHQRVNVAQYMAKALSRNQAFESAFSDFDQYIQENQVSIQCLADIAGRHDAILIDTPTLFRDEYDQGKFVYRNGSLSLYSDKHHLTRVGSSLLVEAIMNVLSSK